MNFRRMTGVAAAGLVFTSLIYAADKPVETDPRLPAGPKSAPAWGFHPTAKRDAALPSVLLIGDSILNAYRTTVIEDLKGKANVDVWLTPAHQGQPSLNEELKSLLTKNGPYAVIHFNFGLHGWQTGRIPAGQYLPLTRRVVQTIAENARGAQLIWASTTPVRAKEHPDQLDPEINATIVDHNAMAAQIMAENKIPIDDLYALMAPKLDLAAKDQFHWSPAGAHVEGHAVAAAIKPYLDRAK
jgi:hypothetical protein